jgi:hypothetical protein
VTTKEKKSINFLKVIDLGLRDNYAQILSIPMSGFSNTPHRIKKIQFSAANVQEFLPLLNQVTWQEVYVESDVNAKFNTLMAVFLYCYNNAFPVKTVHVRDKIKIIRLLKESKFPAKRCGY